MTAPSERGPLNQPIGAALGERGGRGQRPRLQVDSTKLQSGPRSDQSAPVVLPLSALTAPRRVFSSTRRTLEAIVGRVARRRFGRACAFKSKSASRGREA